MDKKPRERLWIAAEPQHRKVGGKPKKSRYFRYKLYLGGFSSKIGTCKMLCLCACKHSKTTSFLQTTSEAQTSHIKMFWKLAQCSWMAEDTPFRLLEIVHPQSTIG